MKLPTVSSRLVDMVNPGAFQGTWCAFLMEQKPLYAAAITGNYAAKCLTDIQQCYFKHYPVDLDYNIKPSPEDLTAVDDDKPDVEPQIPDQSSMCEAEFALVMKAFDAWKKVIEFCKEVRDDAFCITCSHQLFF